MTTGATGEIDSMSLTVLGCSGSYPVPDSACSGYLIQGGGVNVVLDMGPGTLANLQRHIGLDQIDAVVISHSHPDHWTDLTGLRVARKYGLDVDGLRVLSTLDTEMLATDLCVNLEPTFDWAVVSDGDAVNIGALALTFSRTDHYVETLAVGVEDRITGCRIAYSADTGNGWSLEELGTGFDLAVCESTYPTDAEVAGVLHMSAGQAGSMARDAGVGRLVLTHFWPGTEREKHRSNAEATFGGPVDVAEDGAVYDVG